MGQKVHPIGFRLGIYYPHKAVWFTEKKSTFALFLEQDIKIRSYFEKKYLSASIADLVIERKAEKVSIRIKAARPGVLIGRRGDELLKIKLDIKALINDIPEVVIEEEKKPDLVAILVAQSVSLQLEKRVLFRRAIKRALQSVIKAGAKGVRVQVSGRLGGAEIARTEWQKLGRIPLHTLRADIDYATARATTASGIIGVKVWIFKGEKV